MFICIRNVENNAEVVLSITLDYMKFKYCLYGLSKKFETAFNIGSTKTNRKIIPVYRI